jgi:hypothetical protein
MTHEQEAVLGARAREILDNEAFQDAIHKIEQELIQEWKTSPARDHVGREELWRFLVILHKLKNTLLQTVDSGKLANIEIEHAKKKLTERLGIGSWFG